MRKLITIASALSLCLGVSCKKAEQPLASLPPDGPAAGRYACQAGGFKNLTSGNFTIYADGRYEDERPGGAGRFTYDAAKKELHFTSGDFDEWGFIGVYQTAAESNNGQARIVLKEPQYTSEIGKENPGQFHYCYPVK